MTALQLVLEKVWFGRRLTGDDIVVLLLLLTMLASTMHLITMLMTRWGDRNIALKSLGASLLVHSVCFLGLEVFDPLQPAYAQASRETFDPVKVVADVLVQSDDQVALSLSGTTLFPDQASAPEINLDRLPIPARNMDIPEEPERQQEQLETLQTQLPDVTDYAENAEPELANSQAAELRGPRKVAAEDPGDEIRTFHERNRADVFTSETERTLPQSGSLETTRVPAERVPSDAQPERIDTTVNVDTASIDLATSDRSSGVPVRLPQPDQRMERRTSPVSGSEPTEVVGTDIRIRPQRTLPSRSFERRLTRPERLRPSDSENSRRSRVPSQAARIPIPLSSEYEDVRVGLIAPADSDALRSAADIVELDKTRIRRRDQQPAAYRLRSREYRRDAVYRYGGTERSEATVERSLAWLSQQQLTDGHWDASEFGSGRVKIDELEVDRDYCGRDADTGLTALVTLAFLGAGYTHEEGRYAVQVDRAIDWLIREQKKDGSLSGDSRRYARMYCHAMATYALAEALAMQRETVMSPLVEPELLSVAPGIVSAASAVQGGMAGLSPAVNGVLWSVSVDVLHESKAWRMRRVDELRLHAALLNAVRFTIRMQSSGGGWRYAKDQLGDVSMFGWQLMSLKSAEIAGVRVPQPVRDRMFKFINSVRQGNRGGLFGYRVGEEVTPVMTAEALFCQQMLGFERDTARNIESVRYLMDHLPRLSELNLYYWYYGTLAMYQYGGRPWERWNAAVRDTLISEQVTDGPMAGSWDSNGPWGRYGGRLYSTALATLTLEVYYRLLPLYRMNEAE